MVGGVNGWMDGGINRGLVVCMVDEIIYGMVV